MNGLASPNGNFTDHFKTFRTPAQIVHDALHAEVAGLLKECTEKQQAFFQKVWPSWPDRMSEHDLKSALDVVQRTIAKNRAGRTETDAATTDNSGSGAKQ